MTIAVTGSMAFDYIMSFSGSFTDYIVPDQLERLSVSFLVDSMRRERGGVAGNVAYSMALLGERPLLMASVGQDARPYIDDLTAQGVDTSAVLHVDDEFTASFFVSTDRGNRQIANFYIGAMARAAQVSFHSFTGAGITLAIISPNAPDAMAQYVRECKALGIRYVYDPSQQIPLINLEELKAGIEGAHILTVNDYEFGIIQERLGLNLAGVQAMVDVLVITRGEAGSSLYEDGRVLTVPAISVAKVVDPTGAGDAYRAGLLAALNNGLSRLEAGRVGTLTATYALEAFGTQGHRYTVAQFAGRYFNNFERTAGVEAWFNRLAG